MNNPFNVNLSIALIKKYASQERRQIIVGVNQTKSVNHSFAFKINALKMAYNSIVYVKITKASAWET